MPRGDGAANFRCKAMDGLNDSLRIVGESERAAAEDWYPTTNLIELLGINLCQKALALDK